MKGEKEKGKDGEMHWTQNFISTQRLSYLWTYKHWVPRFVSSNYKHPNF